MTALHRSATNRTCARHSAINSGAGPRSASWATYALALMLLVLGTSASAAPKAELWARWQARDDGSNAKLDHSAWEGLLRRHVIVGSDGINRVAYGAFDDADKATLKSYIASLSNTAISRYNAREQMAFWINLYNALTVDVVLQHYPVESIRDIDISPGLFANGPWGKKLTSVEGEALSLDDIEHRILRPIWKDPRIHYAVNCASLGCPNLQPKAFTSSTLEPLLDTGAKEFINHPRAAQVNGGSLRASSIYDWFKEDFGNTDASVIEHLRRYANGPLQAALRDAAQIESYDYDWSVNTVSKR